MFLDSHPDFLISEITGERKIQRHGVTIPETNQTGQDVIIIATHQSIRDMLAAQARSLLKTEVFEH